MRKSYYFLLYLAAFFCIIAFIAHITQVHHYISLHNLQSHMQSLHFAVEQNYGRSMLVYILVVTLCVVCGLPAILPLSLLAGFLFGSFSGTLYALIGVVLGSVISFLLFRYGLHTILSKRYAPAIERLQHRINKLGMSYFLVLYYSMVVPLFFINVMAALTGVSMPRFLGLTIVGSLPVVAICAAAGCQLGSISSIYDIFSPGIIAVFIILILLACAPGIVRYFLRTLSCQQEHDEF